VTLVLRLIRQSRWDSPGEFDWLAAGDIPADPLADFANTSENCLSIWLLDDTKNDLDNVVAALAASREKADKLDYVLFPQSHLDAAGIEVCVASGHTPDEQVNEQHRDLTHLSAAKVCALATSVWHENLEIKRVDEQTVVRLVADAIRRGRISLEKLRPKLRDDVRFHAADDRGGQQKPK
jgi:hypothetical protein